MDQDASNMPGNRAGCIEEFHRAGTHVHLLAGDGFPIRLTRLSRAKPSTKGPVVLVHGAGVRSNIYMAPVEKPLPIMLLDAGFDVWLLDWRASIDLQPSHWTLDDAAVHDYPVAIRRICEISGASEVKAVIHCQGSTSFMMSIMAGLLPQVSTVVSNAVAVHTVLQNVARLKLLYVTPAASKLIDHLNPQWGLYVNGVVPRVLDWLVRATRHECNNAVCKHSSFAYGTGFPTLWRHENLNDRIHEWIKGEFAYVPMSFFLQMGKCVRAGHLVSTGKYDELPADFVAQAPRTDARFVFMVGEKNACFEPEGMVQTFDWFERHAPGKHMFQQVADYGHLDIFMGARSSVDTLPFIVDELER